jgi:hypothetical protein
MTEQLEKFTVILINFTSSLCTIYINSDTGGLFWAMYDLPVAV